MSNDTTQKSDTKRCRKCGEEVLKVAKKCKHCATDLRSWPMRHKILSALLLMFIVPSFLTAMLSDVASENNETTTTATALSDADFQVALATDKPKVEAVWEVLETKLQEGDETDATVQKLLQNPSSGYSTYQLLMEAASADDTLSDQIEDIPVPDLADNQSEQMLRDGLTSLSSAYFAKKKTPAVHERRAFSFWLKLAKKEGLWYSLRAFDSSH